MLYPFFSFEYMWLNEDFLFLLIQCGKFLLALTSLYMRPFVPLRASVRGLGVLCSPVSVGDLRMDSVEGGELGCG